MTADGPALFRFAQVEVPWQLARGPGPVAVDGETVLALLGRVAVTLLAATLLNSHEWYFWWD